MQHLVWFKIIPGFYSLQLIRHCTRGIHVVDRESLQCANTWVGTGFGIYLGCFLRWKSWDAMSEPWPLLHNIVHRMAHPTQHKRTWCVTVTTFLFLNFIYWTFRTLSNQRTQMSA